MSAGKVLNTSNALYSNITRALSGDILINKLVALGGGLDTGTQPHHFSPTASVSGATFTAQQGIAIDSGNWWGISSSKIVRYDLLSNILTTNNDPYSGMPAGLNHAGGAFVDDNFLYYPVEDVSLDERGLAIVDKVTLVLDTYIDFKLNAPLILQASGCCLSKDGTEILFSQWTRINSDPRLVEIHRIDYTTRAYIGKYTLDTELEASQDIIFNPIDDCYYIPYDPLSGGLIACIDPITFEVLTSLDPVGISSEIEGAAYHAGASYYHEVNGSPRTFTNDNIYITASDTTGSTVPVIVNSLMADEGTVILNITLNVISGFPMLMDSQQYSGNWVFFSDSSGFLRFRIDPAQQAILTSSISAGDNHKLAISWVRTGSTVVCKIGLDGIWEATTGSGTWTTPPSDGWWLAGENAGSTRSDIKVYDLLLFDKQLSDAELLDTFNNFNDLFEPEEPITPEVKGFTYTLPIISGIHSDLVVRMKTVDFPFDSIDGTENALDDGGGNLIAYTDNTKITRLSVEIFIFTSSVSPEVNIKIKIPSGFTGATIYIEADDTQTSQPAFNAAFGRDSVNSAYSFSVPLLESSGSVAVDSAGKRGGVYDGSLPDLGVDFGQDLDGSSDWIDMGSDSLSMSTGFTANIQLKANSFTGDPNFYASDGSTDVPTARTWQWRIDSDGKVRIICWDSGGTIFINTAGSIVLITGTTYIIHWTFDGSSYKTYVNGVLDLNIADSTVIRELANSPLLLGAKQKSGSQQEFTGQLGYAEYKEGVADSGDRIAATTDNQLSFGAWGNVGAWEGASSGISITVTEQGPSFTESINATLAKAINAAITESGPSFTESITSVLTAKLNATIIESGPAFTESINATVVPGISAAITEQGPSFTESISVTVTAATGIVVSITEVGPSFTESINAVLSVNLNAAITEQGPVFTESSIVSVIKETTVLITETGPSFTESILVTLPVTITVNPRNVIRVKRKSNSVTIKRKSNIIRVR